uniref:Uncharacterized protein n=1 Tax=Caenorhabditis japonica TaxID=281687 RepID=A0A8R1I704_CAEJA
EVQKLRDDLESLTRGTVANEKGQHVSIEHEIQECRSKSAQLDAGIRTASNRRDRLCPRIDQLLKEHAEVANKDSSEIEKVQNSTQEVSRISSSISAP